MGKTYDTNIIAENQGGHDYKVALEQSYIHAVCHILYIF